MKSKGARNQPAPPVQPQPPASPTAKGAKYRNRDGSKFITLPDTTSAPDSAQHSPTPSAASGAKLQPADTANAMSNGPAPATAPVNRKKQKRREKAAAKAAAEAALNAPSDNGATNSTSSAAGHDPNQDPDPEDSDDEDDQFDSQLQHAHAQTNGHTSATAGKTKKSKKKKKKGSAAAGDLTTPEIPPMPQSGMTHGSGISRERIWNTSSQEERERIKEFWLGLGEDERKSLVKVEKEAVLKKMKEQQKHTCSCSVCGRKRHAIEEELEGLYDAYYEELKHFANHPQQDGHPPMMGASRHFGFHHGNRFPSYAGHQPSRGRIVEHVGDDEEEELDDEAYSEDELDDEYSDEEPEEEVHRDYASEFFNFGSSLTVQGGILTVADDLLKNDGKKFIEMMEQLAERRMAREGDYAQDQYSRGYGHGVNGGLPSHDHPPPPPADEEEYEDDEDEDYDSQEDDEYEEEDDDTMTEEQRMEEGRRMFQIFAARMFEQRVLQAYREKVARERQAKLMEEEEEELRKEEARKEKKAKEAQKKKEKAAQKKQALAEEKSRKEAERAAEEEARRQEEAQKAEEAKRKAEEKRKKKEAQRKAEEDERARKEAERQRQKQMQVEQERKAKEAKEREKKAREEARLKEKESRERKEREVRELKEKQDAEKRQKELESKPSKAAETKPNQKQEQEERAAKKAAALVATAAPVTMTLPKRPSQHATNPALPVLPQHPSTPAIPSPKPSVATPALPKAPTPLRPRQPSQQGAAPGTATASGSASQNPSPSANASARISPGPPGPSSNRGSIASQQSLNLSQVMSPVPANSARFASTAQTAPLNIPPGMPYPPGLHPAPPGFGNPLFAPGAPGFRPPPPGMLPPGLTSPMLGRGFPVSAPPPGFGQSVSEQVPPFNAISKDATPSGHSRQPSGGYDSPSMHAAQPISRPTPIGRPASVVQGQRPPSGSPSRTVQRESDDTQNHLGSSALLDDSEDVLPTLPDFQSGLRRGYVAPVRIGPAYPPPAPFADPAIASMWGSPVQPSVLSPFAQAPVAPPGFGGPGGWPASPSLGFSVPSGMVRPAPARPPASMAIRQILCSVCRDLAIKEPTNDGLIPLSTVQEAMKTYVDFNPMGDGPLTENDIVALCETEGNMSNGGGNFDIHDGEGVSKSIRWNPDKTPQSLGAFGAPGHIGSPVLGSSFGR